MLDPERRKEIAKIILAAFIVFEANKESNGQRSHVQNAIAENKIVSPSRKKEKVAELMAPWLKTLLTFSGFDEGDSFEVSIEEIKEFVAEILKDVSFR